MVSTEEGALNVYDWDQFEDPSDRFLGHPQSVEAMLRLPDDSVVTGSSDGLIRSAMACYHV